MLQISYKKYFIAKKNKKKCEKICIIIKMIINLQRV